MKIMLGMLIGILESLDQMVVDRLKIKIGTLRDLFTKLNSSEGESWWRELKKFLRKEPCWSAKECESEQDTSATNSSVSDVSKVVIDWKAVYKALDLESEYEKSGIQILASNFWEVPVIKGVTMNMVVEALRKLKVNVHLYTDDLDASVTKNDRDPARDGSYMVKFQKNIEVDEEFAKKSANDLAKEEKPINGITLLERLLLELGYFMATKEHLDVNNVTLCSGSRNSGGCVPLVRWRTDSRRVYVDWCYPDYSSSRLRARAVVS